MRSFLGVCLLLLNIGCANASDLTVFAAASLKSALDEVAEHWEAETKSKLRISYAASSTLARQIEQGAPADIYISASVDWMDYLQSRDLIDTSSRRVLAGNRLVLIAHGERSGTTRLAAALGDGPLAMAMVTTVPAGIYGKAALSNLGEWDAVKDRVAQTDNVRHALALVALGEAPFGIVYATDAAVEQRVTVQWIFPEESHPEISYPMARVDGAAEQADALLSFLSSKAAAGILARHGFVKPE
jgi:molybdate transport system substrate-binding protein